MQFDDIPWHDNPYHPPPIGAEFKLTGVLWILRITGDTGANTYFIDRDPAKWRANWEWTNIDELVARSVFYYLMGNQ